MSKSICPVAAAIKEIRGGGFFVDDQEDTRANIIKIGGNESNIEFVCDEVSYYIMLRKMELARFSLSKPDLQSCKNKTRMMFGSIINMDYTSLYTYIIDAAVKKKYLYEQFVQVVNLIGQMESLIMAKIESLGRKGEAINISLPDIFLLPHVDKLIIYRTDILYNTINKIVDYMNQLNINALLSQPQRISIDRVDPYKGNSPDMKTRVPAVNADQVDEYLKQMETILQHEVVVAEYIRDIEKYQCYVINHINQIYDVCKKIITHI